MNEPKCRSCGAQILWLKTAKGKAIPVDIKPTPDGNMVIDDGIARVLKKGEPVAGGKLRWTSHFATCPNAAAHRKS